MNSAEKEAVLHCLKVTIDEALCEDCPLYGTTGTYLCEKDCARLAINALSSSENQNKWIPVDDRLPEIHNFFQLYLVTYKQGKICTAFYTETNGRSWWSIDGVEAWMPLPEPYQSEIPTVAEGSDKE